MTCHLQVTPSCCNIRGNAHGGFLAWLVDQCSSLSLLALSGPGERWVSSGVSTNLNVYYISGAPASPPFAPPASERLQPLLRRVLREARMLTPT